MFSWPRAHATMIQGNNRAIYTRKNKTRLKEDVNFPYKRHILSKIRRDLAKTRLIFSRINGPNIQNILKCKVFFYVLAVLSQLTWLIDLLHCPESISVRHTINILIIELIFAVGVF